MSKTDCQVLLSIYEFTSQFVWNSYSLFLLSFSQVKHASQLKCNDKSEKKRRRRRKPDTYIIKKRRRMEANLFWDIYNKKYSTQTISYFLYMSFDRNINYVLSIMTTYREFLFLKTKRFYRTIKNLFFDVLSTYCLLILTSVYIINGLRVVGIATPKKYFIMSVNEVRTYSNTLWIPANNKNVKRM